MSLLTGHLRERRASKRVCTGAPGREQEESSYRVPLAEGQWQKSGRRVGSERARARWSPKTKSHRPLCGGISALRSASRRASAHGIFARGWLERRTGPPLLPTRHDTLAHSEAEEMRRGACAEWRPLLFSSADSPRNEISALNLWRGASSTRERTSVSSLFARVLQRRYVGAHWARRGLVRR